MLTDQLASEGVVFGRPGLSAGVAVVVSPGLGPSSPPNSVAGLDAAGLIPGGPGVGIGDIYLEFVVPGTTTPASVDAVDFTLGDSGGDDDQFVIRTYDLNDQLLTSQPVSAVSRFPVSLATPGIHRVEIDFTGDYGYSLDDLSFVPAGGCQALPLARAAEPGTICEGESLDLDASTSGGCGGGPLEYRWLEGAQVVCGWGSTPVCRVAPAATTPYTLVVRCASQPGCVDTEQVLVSVVPDVVPPDLGNTLRAVKADPEVWLSWGTVSEAKGYLLRRVSDKHLWPPVLHLSGLRGPTAAVPDLQGPEPRYYYQAAGASCSGKEGP